MALPIVDETRGAVGAWAAWAEAPAQPVAGSPMAWVLAPAWVQNTTTGAGPEDGGPAPRRGARALRARAGHRDRDGRASRD